MRNNEKFIFIRETSLTKQSNKGAQIKLKESENMKQRFIQIIFIIIVSVENILFQRFLMDCESSVAKEMVENNPLELL